MFSFFPHSTIFLRIIYLLDVVVLRAEIIFFLQAVTLADVSSEFGTEALKDVENEFGPNKAIFVKTDVTIYDQFEGICILPGNK